MGERPSAEQSMESSAKARSVPRGLSSIIWLAATAAIGFGICIVVSLTAGLRPRSEPLDAVSSITAERHWAMMEHDLTNFHRSLSTYVRGFLDTGFYIADIVEPTVTPAQVALHPDLDDELRVPNFIVYVLWKPEREE